jgi:glycosyltransferase involved in cell wall biosynthesis
MKFVFLDPGPLDYHADTALTQPLGGSQSAAGYLAVELARRGHEVTLYTGARQTVVVQGVTCRSNQNVLREHLEAPVDAFIVISGPANLALKLRGLVKARSPLVLWTGHAVDQAVVQHLAQPDVRAAWDAVAGVSMWHRNQIVAQFGLAAHQVFALPNAVGPAFERLFASTEELQRAKAGPPVLAYTSTPYRGLNLLLAAFPLLRTRWPEAQLRIYSSMGVYQQPEANDPFRQYYRESRAMAGVTYVGSLSQPALAAELRSASFLAYPNTFPETYCIAAVEALAAGLQVVSSELGALPETTEGFAALVAPARSSTEAEAFLGRFVAAMDAALARRAADPAAFAVERFRQVEHFSRRSTWAARAGEWETFAHALRRDA